MNAATQRAPIAGTIASTRQKLQCACCSSPFGYLHGRVLVIQSRHHGEQHVNTLNLETLFREWLAEQQQHEREPGERVAGVPIA